MLDLWYPALGLLKLIGVGGPAAAFYGLGVWLDREVDATGKAALRSYLQDGLWIQQLANALEAVSDLFDKIFGIYYFSWVALKKSIQIGILAILFCSFLYIFYGHTVRAFPDDRSNYIFWIVYLESRITMGFFVDYLAIMRIRFFFSAIKKSNIYIIYIVISLIGDVLCIIVIALFLEMMASALAYSAAMSGDFVSSGHVLVAKLGEFMTSLIFDNYPADFVEHGIKMVGLRSISNYVAFAPSIIFYLMCIAFVLAKFYNKITPLVTISSKHLRFSKPFRFISTIAGTIVSGMIFVSFQLFLATSN